MTYFQRIIVNTLTFIGLSFLLPNMIHVSSIWVAIIASFVLSILNMCVRPILLLLSLPITIVTFGLFSFVVNGLILRMTSFFVGEQNFSFSSFGSALIVAIVISVINAIVTERSIKEY